MPKWPLRTLSKYMEHYRPLGRSRLSKRAVILKQPTITFWSLTVWVSCDCELILLPGAQNRSFLDEKLGNTYHNFWTSTTMSAVLARQNPEQKARFRSSTLLVQWSRSKTTWLSVLDFVWRLQASIACSRFSRRCPTSYGMYCPNFPSMDDMFWAPAHSSNSNSWVGGL